MIHVRRLAFRFRQWLKRMALNETAGNLERNEQWILAQWSTLLANEGASSNDRALLADIVAQGRENLALLTGALRAHTDEEQTALASEMSRWGEESARRGIAKNVALRDLLKPLSLFRSVVQQSVERMLAQRLYIALPSDVLMAVERINAAIDRQTLAISQAYLRERDQIIRVNEAALEATNRQLVLMNQEMQHRVKNNLQSVADLLSLEISQGVTKPPTDYLRESLNRIKCIAAVHDLLTPGETLATDATALARRVTDIAVRGLAWGHDVRTDVEGPSLPLPTKAATSLALVLNELVNNSLEHGFRGRASGRIAVRFAVRDNYGEMTVQDDGVGLPDDFRLETSQNLGLKIVRALVADDLKGSIAITAPPGGGVVAQVVFPMPEERWPVEWLTPNGAVGAPAGAREADRPDD